MLRIGILSTCSAPSHTPAYTIASLSSPSSSIHRTWSGKHAVVSVMMIILWIQYVIVPSKISFSRLIEEWPQRFFFIYKCVAPILKKCHLFKGPFGLPLPQILASNASLKVHLHLPTSFDKFAIVEWAPSFSLSLSLGRERLHSGPEHGFVWVCLLICSFVVTYTPTTTMCILTTGTTGCHAPLWRA